MKKEANKWREQTKKRAKENKRKKYRKESERRKEKKGWKQNEKKQMNVKNIKEQTGKIGWKGWTNEWETMNETYEMKLNDWKRTKRTNEKETRKNARKSKTEWMKQTNNEVERLKKNKQKKN